MRGVSRTFGRSFLRRTLALGIRRLPGKTLAELAGSHLVAPCYHIVTDDSPAHVRHLYRPVGVSEFESDLEYLARHFHPLTLPDLHRIGSEGRPVPKRSFFLSFDDGFREISEIVAPICKKKGIPATFFLTTGFLNNASLGFRHKASVLIDFCLERGIPVDAPALGPLRNTCAPGKQDLRELLLSIQYGQAAILDECAKNLGIDWFQYLRDYTPYVTTNQVQLLLRDGFSIGGHSVNHPMYGQLSLECQIRETADCLQALTDRFALTTKAFAFPFVSDGVEDAFYEQAFRRGIFDLVFCIGRMPNSTLGPAFQRFGVESDTAPRRVDQLICREVERQLRDRLSGYRPAGA